MKENLIDYCQIEIAAAWVNFGANRVPQKWIVNLFAYPMALYIKIKVLFGYKDPRLKVLTPREDWQKYGRWANAVWKENESATFKKAMEDFQEELKEYDENSTGLEALLYQYRIAKENNDLKEQHRISDKITAYNDIEFGITDEIINNALSSK